MNPKFKNILMFFYIIIPPTIIFLSLLIFDTYFKYDFIKNIVLILGFAISLIVYLFYVLNKKYIFRSASIINYVFCALVLGYSILQHFDLLKYISSVSVIKKIILDTGIWGIFIFLNIQIMQVIFLPVPPVVIILTGTLIYGPIFCAIYCTIGVLIGSYISFIIGKTFGIKIVNWMVGEEKVKKYSKLLSEKGSIILFIAFLFPFFPDDILCLVSGISDMKFKTFFNICTFTRPIGVFTLCLLGGANIFEYPAFLIIIAVLLVIVVVLFLLFYRKFKDKIKAFF